MPPPRKYPDISEPVQGRVNDSSSLQDPNTNINGKLANHWLFNNNLTFYNFTEKKAKNCFVFIIYSYITLITPFSFQWNNLI